MFGFIWPWQIEAAMWLARWDKLADYNAEVARGIVHTPAYDEKMAALQRRFNLESYGTETPEPGKIYPRRDATS